MPVEKFEVYNAGWIIRVEHSSQKQLDLKVTTPTGDVHLAKIADTPWRGIKHHIRRRIRRRIIWLRWKLRRVGA
jgi:hypothetical protein